MINGQELGVDLDGTLLIASTADVLVTSNVVVITGAMLTPHIGALLAATRLLVVAVERGGAAIDEGANEVERLEGVEINVSQSGLPCAPLGYLQIMIVVGYFPALDLGQTEIGYVDF